MNRRIAYSCPFIPMEWIYAHGLQPSRITPDDAFGVSAGMCPYASAFSGVGNYDGSVGGIIAATLCDQMRRASDRLNDNTNIPVFLFNVPSTWKTNSARDYYADELMRLSRFLTTLGGKKPSSKHLASVIRRFHWPRTKLRQAQIGLSSRIFAEAIGDFHSNGDPYYEPPALQQENRGIPIALLGGPLMASDLTVLDFIDASGGWVALNGTENGERGFPAPMDERRLGDDPFDELVRIYFDSIPDPSRRPNELLYSWLRWGIEVRNIRGIVVVYYPWCDLWHAEIQQIKEMFSLPLIDINLDPSDGSETSARNATRIQTLMEML